MTQREVKNVLIVDDEPDLREVIEFDFDQAGYDIFTAEDGLEAWEILQKHPEIRAVVSDIVMPKLNGIDLLRKVRSQSLSPVFVFVTGYSSYDGSEIFSLGGNALVKKPFRRQILVDLCERLLLPEAERWSEKTLKFKAEKNLKKQWADLNQAQNESLFRLGRAGFSLQVSELYRLDMILSFEFEFGPQKMSGIGVVRWIHGQNVGIELLQLDAASLQIWLPQILSSQGYLNIPKNF